MSYAAKFNHALYLCTGRQTFFLRSVDGYTFELFVIEGDTQIEHHYITVEGREPLDRKLMARDEFRLFLRRRGVTSDVIALASKPPASFSTWWRDR